MTNFSARGVILASSSAKFDASEEAKANRPGRLTITPRQHALLEYPAHGAKRVSCGKASGVTGRSRPGLGRGSHLEKVDNPALGGGLRWIEGSTFGDSVQLLVILVSGRGMRPTGGTSPAGLGDSCPVAA